MQIHGVLSHLVAKICQVEKQNKQIIGMMGEAKEHEKKSQDGREKRNDLKTTFCIVRDDTAKNKYLEEEETKRQFQVPSFVSFTILNYTAYYMNNCRHYLQKFQPNSPPPKRNSNVCIRSHISLFLMLTLETKKWKKDVKVFVYFKVLHIDSSILFQRHVRKCQHYMILIYIWMT